MRLVLYTVSHGHPIPHNHNHQLKSHSIELEPNNNSETGLHLLSPRTKLLTSAVTRTQIPKQLATRTNSIHAGVGKPANPANSTNANTPDLVTPARAPICIALAVSGLPLTFAAVATAAGPAAAFTATSNAARAKNVHTRVSKYWVEA